MMSESKCEWRTSTNEEQKWMKKNKNKMKNKNEWTTAIYITKTHKNLTGGSPKQNNIAGSFWLLILKNDYKINYHKKSFYMKNLIIYLKWPSFLKFSSVE